ncbi:alkylbase DNA glycosidase-like protein mag2 [Nicotiana tabacum]|uniref:Alkylbase DNA glycosidase-like protein mag2 n=2 Tax=Nicotiana TaxID=4085 RepID=A0A1S3ZMN0_TOBAC|nr:PREDICTED: probable DNA-3-methyladenine glycosylase 2 [Nicotiana sylvestris]XP_016465549.1 PREDICTED: probable DNA-3-methyladenine glycosylase 2 [Nicotiana tabacum]
MGEQTQTQTITEPQTPSLSQPNSDSTTLSTNPPVDIPPNPSNPSKIPIRPQKIRKLSSTTSPQSTNPKPADSSQSVVTSNGKVTITKNRRRSASQLTRVLPQVIKPLSANGEIENALRHLRLADPLLCSLIDTLPLPAFDSHQLPFLALCKSILYQQLAYKAGTSIYTRFVSLCGSEDAVCPDVVLSLSAQQLKQIGISGRKASYLYDLANKYKTGILADDTVVKMDDRSLFTMLSMVKGIGSWSVHMFMIFSLHRPDVLPVSDLGVRKGVQMLYGLEELPRPSQMEQLCEKWRPYRSIGAWYMWRFIEGKGTPATAAAAMEGGSVQPLQQIEPQQQPEQQHQLQLLEPIDGIGSLGACIWGQ